MLPKESAILLGSGMTASKFVDATACGKFTENRGACGNPSVQKEKPPENRRLSESKQRN